eukprot:TRINITY_DN44609_c0_g1_i1.p1 TRINITY_DN44609_c0_g1~~TRINITY_DN44609_c0_g1_i1.p1  ORF type:complete len:343 (-),score=45.61 TRINITY_DN44609_c0_g1_i1:635-1663(-)
MVLPRAFSAAISSWSGRANAKHFWKVSRAGFPIIQVVPKESVASRTSYSTDFLYTLTTDVVRMDAFREAIRRCAAKRVLEIGCGPWAPLTEMAVAAGAKEVVAIEASAEHAAAAQSRLKRAQGCSVTVMAGRASEVTLPNGFMPDLVVAELLGYTASEEGAPAIFFELQRRLISSGQSSMSMHIVPRSARSFMVPVRPLRLSLWHRFRNWWLHGQWPRLQPGTLYDCRNFPRKLELGEAQIWEEYDFGSVDLEHQLQQARELQFRLPEGTPVGGILLWMQADIDDAIKIDTHQQNTSWNQYYIHFPLQQVTQSGRFVVSAAVDARTEDVRYSFTAGSATYTS